MRFNSRDPLPLFFVDKVVCYFKTEGRALRKQSMLLCLSWKETTNILFESSDKQLELPYRNWSTSFVTSNISSILIQVHFVTVRNCN